jgi:toxin ParE1/3/4
VRRPLIVNPEAEADLADAKAWYDHQRPELGDDFLRRVGETLSSVERMPELRGKFFEELRVALVDRFPYAVVYRIDDEQITVVAVYHTSRNPRGWQDRS